MFYPVSVCLLVCPCVSLSVLLSVCLSVNNFTQKLPSGSVSMKIFISDESLDKKVDIKFMKLSG